MVMLDARTFNARFVATAAPGCRYLLAAQCHPDAFELCRDRDVTVWHACSAGETELKLIKDYYFDQCFPIGIGTTVAIRAISLLRMLGFVSFDIFGLDSCWIDHEHHAYEQAENDKEIRLPIWLRPKNHDDKAERFACSPWHIRQAQDFMELIRKRGEMIPRLQVHGNGLIAAEVCVSLSHLATICSIA